MLKSFKLMVNLVLIGIAIGRTYTIWQQRFTSVKHPRLITKDHRCGRTSNRVTLTASRQAGAALFSTPESIGEGGVGNARSRAIRTTPIKLEQATPRRERLKFHANS